MKNQETLLRTEPIMTWEHIAKFKPHAIVTFGKFSFGNKQNGTVSGLTQTNEASLKNLQKPNEEGYNGYMSPATSRNVKGIIENLLTAIELNTDMQFPFVKGQEKPLDKVYPTFVTLTLPFKQMHDDNDIKRDIFTPFMQEMIRNWNVRCYVWVAETQDNGNVHFHVLMDRGIPALRLRQIWNHHLNKDPYQYVDCYTRIQQHIYRNGYVFREEMLVKRLIKERARAKAEKRRFTAKDKATVRKKEEKRQKEAYPKGVACGWTDPNSTDIHAIQNIKKLTAYVTKYFTKKPDIVKPALAPNQRFIETEGRYFIETDREVEDLDTMMYDPDIKVEVTDTFSEEKGQFITTVTERRPHPPTFKNRKLTGRIWGAAERLKDPETKPCPYALSLSTWHNELHVVEKSNTRSQTFSVEVGTDLFGRPQYRYETRQVTHRWEESDERQRFESNQTGKAYLELMLKLVPPKEVQEATLKAGVLFASKESNKVIPLREPQKDYLREHSPPLWEGYQAHYTAIFNTLYAAA